MRPDAGKAAGARALEVRVEVPCVTQRRMDVRHVNAPARRSHGVGERDGAADDEVAITKVEQREPDRVERQEAAEPLGRTEQPLQWPGVDIARGGLAPID